jgi:hypothetical protein
VTGKRVENYWEYKLIIGAMFEACHKFCVPYLGVLSFGGDVEREMIGTKIKNLHH